MREWATPLSILCGSVIVGLGLYLGLRERAPSVEPAPVSKGDAPRPALQRKPGPFEERERRRAYLDADGPTADEPGNDEANAEVSPDGATNSGSVAAAAHAGAQAPASQVERDAAEAFETVRAEVVDKCWNSLPDDPDAPSSVSVDLSLSYDPEGNLIATGVSEDRAARRDGVATCLGPIVHNLKIPPPGAHRSARVRVTIP